MGARQTAVLSSAICIEVLSTLRQVFAREGPDEPDLGLNIAYATARASLHRLVDAEPWEVPGEIAQSIRHRLDHVVAIVDPEELDTQLLSLPGWVWLLLDRRSQPGSPQGGPIFFRRAGDRLQRLTQASESERARS